VRVAIVDDESMARLRLRRLLGARSDVVAVDEYASAREFLQGFIKRPVDVVLLDVEMPGMDGFAALQELEAPRPAVVFVTAYSNYAVQGFAVDASDYLLKPVSSERLNMALERAQRDIHRIPDAGASRQDGSRIPLQSGSQTLWIDPARVEYIKADGNHVIAHERERSFSIRWSLAAMESRLSAVGFLRVHRALLVRVDAVREVRPLRSGRYELGLLSGVKLQTGRNYKAAVYSFLKLG
jgi:two-component system, LytTR family, response regulator